MKYWFIHPMVVTVYLPAHPYLQTLGFLAQDGIMRFINIHSCKQLFHIGSPHLVRSTPAVGVCVYVCVY